MWNVEVKSIGVICRLDNEQNWNVLHHFAKVMENQGKSVHIIALQDQDINFVVTHQATTICRLKTDLNFWGIPSWDSIKSFAENEYDLLIDTIVYATPAEDPTEIFDLIIRGDGRVELKSFFNNIIEYLGMIKK